MRKIWSGGRHVFGILEKNNKTFFLKLATTEGISLTTKNEFNWNAEFNKLVSRKTSNFWVPKNYDFGLHNNLFYFITDNLEGKLSNVFINNVSQIINFSEIIQGLKINFPSSESFLEKTQTWFSDIPANIREEYKIESLLKIVKKGYANLQIKPRHGDFTPWHMLKLPGGKLGLIDGEHARSNGVEYYDIGYFIQRAFSVLENPKFAKRILSLLLKRNYNLEKLKVILAARSIGGFLDKSLEDSPDYTIPAKFCSWILKLHS